MGTAYHSLILPVILGYRHLPIPPEIVKLLLQEAVQYSGKAHVEEPNSLIVTNDCKPFGDLEDKVLRQILSAKAGLKSGELAEALDKEGYCVFLLMPSKDLIVPQGMESSVLV